MNYLKMALFCLSFGILSHAQIQRNIIHEIQSKSFNDDRTIQVHVPKKFKNTEQLPVIFVFDAQWDTYFELVTSIIDYLVETREFPRSIIVGIHNEKRQYELTPVSVNEDWKMPSLGGAKFLETHLENEVIPFLKKTYNTENFSIGIGHSLGGTFVLNSLIDAPNLFNAYIAISPNLQLDDEEIRFKIQQNLPKIKSTNKFVYTTIGTEGNPDTQFLPPVKKLDSIVQDCNSTNFNWNFKVYKGYNHATTPIVSIQSALLKLSEKWNMSEKQKEEIIMSNNIVEQFKLFYEKLSEWAGYTVTPQKHDYYNFVGFLERNNKYNEVVNIYKSALKYYPTQSRFYNGIAENMIKLGHNKEAKTYLQLALKTLKNEAFDYEGDKKYFGNIYKQNLKKLSSNE